MTGRRNEVHWTSGPSRVPGAPSHGRDDWNQIDWEKIEQDVNRLQVRIAKAAKEGRWGKVCALQHLLTHSFSGKALAVRRVTGNRGRRTPGVDGETWVLPARKLKAVHQLRQRGYRPKPLRRVYIPKRGTTKMRPLGIPTMRDRAMQALYQQALLPVAETTGDENSYGFRPERSTADALMRCYTILVHKCSAQWILEGDIKACFDRISHDWLLDHVPMDRAILRKWLKAGFLDSSILYPTEEGTPQGGIISPVLANMALDGLQRVLRERFPMRPKGRAAHQVHFVRYADDFIVTADSKEVLEEDVIPLLERFLEKRGLELSPTKTVVTHIEDGFDFLGQTVRKYNGKYISKPSKKALHAFLQEVRRVIKEHAGTAGALVIKLNPLIRGWANYHRHAASGTTFCYVDYQVWEALWRWAVRKHPHKGRRWVARKYFRTTADRSWVFTGQVAGREGKPKEMRLFYAASLPIRRHTLIKGAAHPFDPEWQAYFQARRERKRKDARHARQSPQGGRTELVHFDARNSPESMPRPGNRAAVEA